MVMFKEDEERIKAMEKAEKLAKRGKVETWLRRFVKTGIVLGVVFVLSLGLLSALGGNHEALKKGIEDYITQSTGLHTDIGTFNHMRFFPSLSLDVADVSMRKNDKEAPVVTIESAKFSTGFLSLMFSRRHVDVLDVRNINMAPGLLWDKRVTVSEITIEETGNGQDEGQKVEVAQTPVLSLRGIYGEETFSASAVLEENKGHFRLPKSSRLNAGYGALRFKGKIEKAGWGAIKLHIDEIAAPEQLASGYVSVKNGFRGNRYDLDLTFGKSRVKGRLKAVRHKMDGALTFPVLYIDDIAALSSIYGLWQNLAGGAADDLIDFDDRNVGLGINVDELRGEKATLGHVSSRIAIKKQIVSVDTDGTINGGKLDGKIGLDASSLPASLSVNWSLKEWDYGEYQRAMQGKENLSGKADVKLSLRAKGKTYDALLKGLNGEAVLIAGKGKLASKTLNVWGAGLANAMLPNLSGDDFLTLNCMIADFKVENSIARPSPFFMDTVRVTVVGDGEVNLPANMINLKLEPKAKDPAFLDVATAVNVKGPILSPSVGADTFSLFEKIGGLALGLVNPAFLVFSMTDLGLNAEHPCYNFIEKPAEKDAEAANEKVKTEGQLNE